MKSLKNFDRIEIEYDFDTNRQCFDSFDQFIQANEILNFLRGKNIEIKNQSKIKEALFNSNNWYLLAVKSLLDLISKKRGIEDFWAGIQGKLRKSKNEKYFNEIKNKIMRLAGGYNIVKEITPQAELRPFEFGAEKIVSFDNKSIIKNFNENKSLLQTGKFPVLVAPIETMPVEMPFIWTPDYKIVTLDIEVKEKGFSIDKDYSAGLLGLRLDQNSLDDGRIISVMRKPVKDQLRMFLET